MLMSTKAPSLVKLCIGTAIANLRYIGDVGGLEMHLLEDILPHCTVDQLMHIENSTEPADLTPVTNDLWKRFYEQQFGAEHMMLVMKRMKQKHVAFKWRLLYEAKTKERKEFQSKSAEKLKKRYEEELAKKQRKQVRICSKVPPSSNKRSFSLVGGSGYNLSHIKSNIMKKAKLEYLNSNEVKMHAAMRRNIVERKSCLPRSAPPSKPTRFLDKSSASTSRISK